MERKVEKVKKVNKVNKGKLLALGLSFSMVFSVGALCGCGADGENIKKSEKSAQEITEEASGSEATADSEQWQKASSYQKSLITVS